MITLFISILVLILGYRFYSKFLERVIEIDSNRATPAITMTDGIDYVPMSWWRVLLIQFLNIAGLGPVFGAIAGAMWGPVAFLWIVFGTIFGGALHDFFSGMLSVRHGGLSITEVIGKYLGYVPKQIMRVFTVVLLVLTGVVFISGPAGILANITPETMSFQTWIWIIFIYYILATLLPIDKIIGKIYPIFGFALMFMALSLIIALIVKGYQIPELTIGNLHNFHNNKEAFPIFPMMFISIACGAISGFHATQSPLMARCLKNESEGRRVFYGAMVIEAVVALIWAAIAMSFFGGVNGLNDFMLSNKGSAALVVDNVSNSLLGTFGAILAILGVVAAPITSGDTAFRSARLTVADLLNFNQKKIRNRLLITIPLFAVGFMLTKINFDVIWRYFAWSNQALATIVLWTITIYLFRERKNYWVTLFPALFMTSVVITYLMLAPEGFAMSRTISYTIGFLGTFLTFILFFAYTKNKSKSQ